jgi:hypothetical protein
VNLRGGRTTRPDRRRESAAEGEGVALLSELSMRGNLADGIYGFIQ